MSIYEIAFDLYENGELVFLEDDDIFLSGFAIREIRVVSSSLNPAFADEDDETTCKRFRESTTCELVRRYHLRRQAEKAAQLARLRPDFCADLKSALRIH